MFIVALVLIIFGSLFDKEDNKTIRRSGKIIKWIGIIIILFYLFVIIGTGSLIVYLWNALSAC